MSEARPPKTTHAKHQPLELIVLMGFILTWLVTKDAILATLALTVGTIIQALIMMIFKMPVTKMQKAMFVAILIGGGLTVALRDPQFIKWKLTVVNAIFAGALLVLQSLGKSPIKTMLNSIMAGQDMRLEMPEKAWRQLTFIFIGFFSSVSVINTYITLYMDFEAWVYFRTGLFFVSMIFFPLILMLFLMKHKALQQTASAAQDDHSPDSGDTSVSQESKKQP